MSLSNDFDNVAHRPSHELMERLIKDNVRPYLSWVLTAVFFMVVSAAAAGMSAWLLRPAVDEVFIAKREDLLWMVGLAIFLAFSLKSVATYIQSVLMNKIGFRIIADNQSRLFQHLMGLDISFFHSQSTGKLISRFTTDITAIRTAVSDSLTGAGRDFATLVAYVTVMFMQNWQLACIAFFVFPVAIYPIVRLGKRMRKNSANTQKENAELMTLLDQSFQGVRVIKAYGMEPYEEGRASNIMERIYGLSVKAARIRGMASPLMEWIGGLAISTIIVYGGHQVINEQTTPGAFFSFIAALLLAYEPMKKLANLNVGLQAGLAGAQRLFNLLDVKPVITDPADAKELQINGGHITFNDVSFYYEEDAPALKNITLEAPAGKTIALVGPSGAGKSTILNLVPRFYDVTSGTVCIDTQDIQTVTQKSLRAGIALVSQEIALFDDTIQANIAYGKAGASFDEIIEAAKAAAAHDFIEGLPGGYNTVVGEQGVKLSGGQRQRLAIARAILKNAPILLLDEATSALDTESERQVQAALDGLMKDRTTIVIAHRLSTVVSADLIYVIDRGEIVERGSHQDLLGLNGHYAKLYALQFANDEKIRNSADEIKD